VYGAFIIDRLEGIRCGQDIDFVERLRAIQAFPVVDGPVFVIKLKAVVVFLKEVRSPAKGTHDRVHNQSSDFRSPGHTRERENRFSCSTGRTPDCARDQAAKRTAGTWLKIKYTVIS
jgi:hypothetical protein